jgi:hypothetical protein
MSKERSLVRASEIGLWAFCQRAWWLAHVKATPHQSPARLAHGERVHQRHGRVVWAAQWLTSMGMVMVGLALVSLLLLVGLWLLS